MVPQEQQTEDKPDIRLIHSMARTGSTVIGKCLGCMDGINLLSEIHPLGISRLNPLSQAHQWFNLLIPRDIERLQQEGIPFVEAIKLVELRSRERGEVLIIRDWGQFDFIGFPYIDNPSYTIGLAEALKEDFKLIQTAIVRHPLDQWLSLYELEVMADAIDSNRLTVSLFLQGYLKFAYHCQKIDYIRYEDFTEHPEQTMEELCDHLHAPFDPSFIERWHQYTTISGDRISARGSNEIRPMKRREYEPAMLASFERDPAYHEALEILNYTA